MRDILKKWTVKDYICFGLAVILLTTFGLWLLRHDLEAEGRLTEDIPILSKTVETEKTEQIEESAQEPEKIVPSEGENGISPSGLVNINTATEEELITLPNIGEAKAKRIIEYREKSPFKQVRDIKKVSGIGDKTFEILKDKICVSNEE